MRYSDTNQTKGAQLMFWITPNIQLMNGFYDDSDRVSAPFFR